MAIDLSWPLFEIFNPNKQDSFEDMCRRIFTSVYLKNQKQPHINHNLPGVEVLPILEPERNDGEPKKRISFQAKYISPSSNPYKQFIDSAKETVKHFAGKLDRVYLFCNRTLTTTTKQYRQIKNIHSDAGIDTVPVTNRELIDLIARNTEIAEMFFQQRNTISFPLNYFKLQSIDNRKAIKKEDLAGTTVHATVGDYNEDMNVFTVTIFDYDRHSIDEIEQLAKGDSINVGDMPHIIKKIKKSPYSDEKMAVLENDIEILFFQEDDDVVITMSTDDDSFYMHTVCRLLLSPAEDIIYEDESDIDSGITYVYKGLEGILKVKTDNEEFGINSNFNATTITLNNKSEIIKIHKSFDVAQ